MIIDHQAVAIGLFIALIVKSPNATSDNDDDDDADDEERVKLESDEEWLHDRSKGWYFKEETWLHFDL